MANVLLSDIIDVTVFQDLPAVNSVEKTAFFESGIIARNALLDGLANAPGKLAELPFWKDLGDDEVNYSTDATTDVATPLKTSQGEQISRKIFLNQGWSAADLASELVMGADAMTHIRSRVDAYFTRQWQRKLIASVNGVYADNVANDAGDMVNDVALEAGLSATAANKIGVDSFVDLMGTMGDSMGEIAALAVHSAVYRQMIKNNDIDFVQDSTQTLQIPTFMGKRLIVDDSMPVVAGATNGFKYTSVAFGAGAFGYGEGAPITPVEVEREAAQGNGAGIETLWVRKTWLLHPMGFQHTGTPAGVSFNNTELAAATSWDRVVDRKNVPMAFLVTNG